MTTAAGPNPAGLVNQRLYHCRLLLDQVDAAAPAALVAALEESALLQLRLGYACYLQELAELLRGPAWPARAGELRAALRAQGRDAAEVEHLEHLESSGWLGDLLVSVADIERPHGQARSGVIAVDVAVERGCRQWLHALEELVARHREQLQEW